MSNHVTSCPNVLKLNYIDSKKSANSWNTKTNKLGTMWGPINMLRTLNTNKNIDFKCLGINGVQYVTYWTPLIPKHLKSATFEKIDILMYLSTLPSKNWAFFVTWVYTTQIYCMHHKWLCCWRLEGDENTPVLF